ncbi:MAG: hypothetical protein GVY30_04395 [Chloroflexi bacterium]|jgi:hypothetical protein|nr:hypothetical protein [Chloroflexota bacterium]
MTKRQKFILILLALLDVAVIVMLGSLIYLELHPRPVLRADLSPCAQQLLAEFGAMDPQIAWDATNALHLALTLPISDKASGDVAPSAQALWPILDALAEHFSADCPAPRQVTIRLAVRDASGVTHHVAQIDGATLTAWREGDLSDANFAAQARYRRIMLTPQ